MGLFEIILWGVEVVGVLLILVGLIALGFGVYWLYHKVTEEE